MNYGQIYDCDVANGPGLRVSLFVSGCSHHCPGCFNEIAWDPNFGKPFTSETALHILEMLDKEYIQGLTVLGGEPMERYNQKAVADLLSQVRTAFPQKDIWLYSGYTFEQLTGKEPCLSYPIGAHILTDTDFFEKSLCRDLENTDRILSCLDVLVDGRFVMAEKDVTLKFRGSRNQRVLDMKASLREEAPIWMEAYR